MGIAYAQTNTLTVEIGSTRSSSDPVATAVKKTAKNIAAITDGAKRRLLAKHPNLQISFPTRVNLTRNGIPVRTRSTRGGGPITLTFSTTTGHTFPATYQTFLQTVFSDVQSELTAKFGQPFAAGNILVSNYDATIDDRDAVAGGIYLPDNGSGQQEIRFPVYNSNETAAVNFVHTLLLAYQGTTPYPYDGLEEGLVRGVTATIMRENLISGLDLGTIESILSSTYDVQGYYDWYNQRGLAGPLFIAPNLKAQTVGAGTNGGLYLLRYRMSGSAWSKVLTEYPAFAKDFNTLIASDTSVLSSVPTLVQKAQTVISTERPSNATVEGLSFSEWFRRQFILQPTISAGTKLVVEAVPETPDTTTSTTPDFGLFDFATTYFSTDSSGNETLLNATAYPLYLDSTYNRFSPAAQDDQMAISVGYGSVTPNFLSSYEGGLIYRVAVDIPVNDQVTRVFVPAGGVSTSSNATPNELFGTVSGVDLASGDTLDVKVYVGADLVTDAPVVNGAFGVNVISSFVAEYNLARTIEVQVWKTSGATNTMLLDRFVDKPTTGTLADGSQIGFALDLRVNQDSFYNFSLAAGINALGFPIDPFESDPAAVLGATPSQLLVARYDGVAGKYALNPNVEPFKIGHGYFTLYPTGGTVPVAGRGYSTTPLSVALAPGWNLISNPYPTTVSQSQVLVYHANDLTAPATFLTAATTGTLIGNTFFQFVPGANDSAAGYPTAGSFTAATQFAPGQAYFVQCLAPEGVVLEFTPGTTSGVKVRSSAQPAVAPTPKWQVHVGITTGNGDSADCVVGMAAAATTGIDRALDSGIPPSVGGLQIVSNAVQPLYRDFQPIGHSVSYSLAVSNLKVGKAYTMRFVSEAGFAPRVTLKNGSSGVISTIQRNGRYYFVATSSSQTFTLTAIGVGN